MTENEISTILYIVLIVMIAILIVLSIVFCILSMKEKKRKQKTTAIITGNKKANKDQNEMQDKMQYNKQSIFDFMEFEKIEDNMIVVKDGRKYIMVVECQGVNYDLMSRMEKIAVEEGFQQFLNTLRHPIQIYIQTRTVNLSNSLQTYHTKIKEIEDKYRHMTHEYNRMKESEAYTEQELQKYLFEVNKQRNLLEYGSDIIKNTEQISLNKGVLNKKYYVIIPYFFEEVSNEKVDIQEIRSIAFSELYTKCQSIIRTLSACSVMGKILSSKELVDLLYVAYNRDESEAFGTEKMYQADYESLYSTGQDVYEKKLKILDEVVKDRAVDLANEKMEKARSKAQQLAEEKENSLEALVDKMAELILDQNRNYVGEEIAEEAIKEIKEEAKKREEGGKNNEKVKTTRTRKKSTSQ